MSGCATAPVSMPSRPPGIPGTYHRVLKGQTLWRISKMYGVDLEELATLNRITDATKIEEGQLIFIPNRKEPIRSMAQATPQEDFSWPLRGRVIAAFGTTYNGMVNKGINIEARFASDVLASRSGTVVFAGNSFGAYGNTVIIDHGDGFATVYARNAELLVQPGQRVSRGQPIAKAGSGAGRDKGTYLHFEIRRNHVAQNPYFYLP